MRLRLMTMEDADKMLEWKNYPETRKYTIVNHHRIGKKSHIAWLKKNIQYFRVIEVDGKPAGAIRVQDKEISVWIDRDFRGKSLASQAIKKVSKKGYTAKIVTGNVASMRCFIKCGFYPVSFKDNYYLWEQK